MSDSQSDNLPLSEFAIPVISGLDEDAEEVGVAPFDKTTAEEIITRLAEIDAARQRAEATSRDSYVT
jgi:hypothetical protein